MKEIILDFFKKVDFDKLDMVSKHLLQKAFNGKFEAYKKLLEQEDIELIEKVFLNDLENKNLDADKLLSTIARVYFVLKEYENSIKIDKMLVENSSDILLFQSLYNLASTLYIVGEFEDSKNNLAKCIQIIENNKLDLKNVEILRVYLRASILYIAVLSELGEDSQYLYKITKNTLEVLNKYKQYLRSNEEIEYFLVQLYIQISSIQNITQNYDGALEYAKEALKVLEEKRVYIANEVKWGVYFNLAYAYEQKEDYKKAYEYANKAQKVSKRLKEDDPKVKRTKALIDSLKLKEDVEVYA